MHKIGDNVLLLGMGLVLAGSQQSFIAPVLSFLLAVCVCATNLYFIGKRPVEAALAGYFAVSLVQPIGIMFLPAMWYAALSRRIPWAQALCLGIFGWDLWKLWGQEGFSVMQVALLICFWGTATYLQWKTERMEKVEGQLIHTRDSGAELNMRLKEKNKNLMEKQDYEIYLATLKERNRIAREIHDNVGHLLSRTLLQTGALLVVSKEEACKEGLNSIKDSLNQAMTSIRQSVHDLHDDSIDLKKALEDILTDLSDYTVHFEYDASNTIPRNVKYCFITTVKEAVNNTIKHSEADAISVVLREHPAFYQLLVADNGQKKAEKLSGGIGLENMRSRVEDLRGSFHINTEQGFRIFISIPKSEELE